jgi:hypothetical protein
MYKWLVRMVLEKFREFCDINIASDFEEFRMWRLSKKCMNIAS